MASISELKLSAPPLAPPTTRKIPQENPNSIVKSPSRSETKSFISDSRKGSIPEPKPAKDPSPDSPNTRKTLQQESQLVIDTVDQSALITLLTNLYSSDLYVKSHAESLLDYLKKYYLNSFCLRLAYFLLSLPNSQVELQDDTLDVLNCLLTRTDKHLWPTLSPLHCSQLKPIFLDILKRYGHLGEFLPKLHDFLSNIVADSILGDGWPELIDWMFVGFDSTYDIIQQSALLLFSLAPHIGEQLTFWKGNRMVKMGALAALGTVACTSKDHFQNYYSMVMPYLKVILMSAINEPNRMLLAKSIECITMVWTAVGKEKFKADTELLIISNTVGTITLVSLTGLVVFILFTLAANINAIVISLLASLVAAGSFLALFFACVTAIYIGALSIAFFVISVATSFTIVAIVIATGWIGFFWTVWLATKKSFGIAKHSLTATGSAISTYSSARQARHLLKTLSD